MAVTLASASSIMLAACGTPEGDPELILRSLSEATSGADAAYAAHTLRESMPNQTFTTADETQFPGSESVVIGTVIDAEAESSHALADESVVDAPVGSPDATWTMARVELDVEEARGAVAGEETVTFVLPIRGSDVDAQVASIRSLGDVVVFLVDGRVARNEALLGLVSDGGAVTFPIASGSDDSEEVADPFFEGIDTVSELRDALSRGQRPEIRLDENGQRVTT